MSTSQVCSSSSVKRSQNTSSSSVAKQGGLRGHTRLPLQERSGNSATPKESICRYADVGQEDKSMIEMGSMLHAPPNQTTCPTRQSVYLTYGQTVTHAQHVTPGGLPLPTSVLKKAVHGEGRDGTVSKHCHETPAFVPALSLDICHSLAVFQAEGRTAAAAAAAAAASSGVTFSRRSFQRPQTLQSPPTLGKVYYMPDGKSLPTSIIHHQQRNAGFFNHPVLVTGVEGGGITHFYALTRAPPQAIGQLSMCLRIGTAATDAGPGVLKLASGSAPMRKETWVNLERRFSIEWENLESWAGNVAVDAHDLWKLWRRVAELEADQNRYLYKPLPRDMRNLPPGIIVLLPNEVGASTLGAPVLLVENAYPRFRFLRVKILEENGYFNPATWTRTRRKHVQPRHMCLEISPRPKMGHDGTPVMLLEPESPAMRQPSYVEVFAQARVGNLDECKTWCWPPVLIRQQSMLILHKYMAVAAAAAAASASSSSQMGGGGGPLSPGLPVDPYSLARVSAPEPMLPTAFGWNAGLTEQPFPHRRRGSAWPWPL